MLVGGIAIHEFTRAERQARAAVAGRRAADRDRAPHRAADHARDRRAPALPGQRRHRLPVDGPRGGDAVGRRGAAHPAGHADRLGAGRACSTCSTSRRSACTSATTRSSSRRSSACARSATRCSSSSTTSRRCARPTTSSTSARGRRARRRIIAEGTAAQVEKVKESLTGQFLAGTRDDPGPGEAAHADGPHRDPRGAAAQPQVARRRRPAGRADAASPACRARASRRWSTRSCSRRSPTACTARASARARTRPCSGLDPLDKIIQVDQSPIGRTPRSNPATYTGLFDVIRDLFSKTPGGAGARLQAGALLVQRQGRALRGVPRRRPDQDRDALPARRLRAVRAVPRQALQQGDARHPLQGQDDRRRARHAGRGGASSSSSTSRRSAAAWRRSTRSGSATSGSASPRRRCRAARRSA